MDVIQYKCPHCGANIEFGAGKQDFTCKYCDSSFTAEQLAEIYPDADSLNGSAESISGSGNKNEIDVKTPEEAEQEKLFAAYNSLYNCPSCGASVVTEENTAATHCFYCHSPVILAGRLSGEYKPSVVIPFTVDKEKAMTLLKKHCAKRWFLPKGFKDNAALAEILPIYTPYWVADCEAGGRITARCKKIRVWRDGRYQYTETKEYVAVRAGGMNFDGIPADASQKADDTLMECLEPFKYEEAVPFKLSYLSGFLAEKYDVDKDSVFPKIRSRAQNSATSALQSSITGYNSVNIVQNTVDVRKTAWKHMLLPVWFLSYKYKDRQYHFAMNGQTGKYAGNLPVVWGKVAAFAAVSAVLLTAVGAAAGYLI